MANTIDLSTYAFHLELDDKTFTTGMKNAEKQTDNLQNKMGGFNTFIKTSLIAGLAGVGVAITGIITKGVTATAQLDEQMSKFQASTGATQSQVEELKSLTQDLYKVNTDSYEDIVKMTDGLKKQMGLSIDEIKKYQQSYMDFSKVTGQSNEESVKSIAGISKAWGLTAEESAKSLDILKLSNEKFGGDIKQVQTALQEIAPSAKALGLSFEETNGYLNLFTKAGLNSTQAVTAFTYAAKQVKNPEEFKKMVNDLQAIKDPTERAQKAVELFGARAGVSLANALDGSKSLDDLMVSFEEAEGTVSKASAAFDSNLNVQLELTKKLFLGLVQELGEKFMPVINEILKWIQENLPAIIATVEKTIDTIGNIIDTKLNFIIDVIKNVIGVIKGIFEMFAGILTGDFNRFSEGLKMTWSNLWKGIESILNGASGLIESIIRGLITNIGNWFKGLANEALEWGRNIVLGLGNGIESMAGWVKQKVLGFVNNVKSTITDFFGIRSPSRLMEEYGEYIGEGLANGIEKSTNLVKDKAKLISKIIVDENGQIREIIGNFNSELNNNALNEQLSNYKAEVDEKRKAENEKYREVKDSLFDQKLAWNQYYNELNYMEQQFINTRKSNFTQYLTGLKADLTTFFDFVKENLENIGQDITTNLIEKVNQARQALSSIVNTPRTSSGSSGGSYTYTDSSGNQHSTGANPSGDLYYSDGRDANDVEAARQQLIDAGLFHQGGIVGNVSNRITELVNKLFNVQPNEQIVKALKGELFVPQDNIINNFIPNMRNLMGSNPGNVINNNNYNNSQTINVNVEKIVSNNPKDFFNQMKHIAVAYRG